MQNSNTSRNSVPWKALFVSPSDRVIAEMTPLFDRYLPGAPIFSLKTYPNRQQLVEAMSARLPNLCFLDTTTDQEKALAVVPELLRIEPALPIIVLLASNDPDLILRCLRLGASEFVIQPVTGEQLESAVERLEKLSPSNKNAGQDLGKVYCVVPVKGASGASTIACNLAYQWKRLGSKRILLADLDPYTGILGFLLKTKSAYSFMDVLSRSSGLDADLWKSMVKPCNGVDALLAPETMVEGINELADAAPVIEYARQNYDIVILDADNVYGEWNLSQAKMCDELLLVSTNELACLQAAQRALAYLESHRVGRWKVRLIINRYDRDYGLSREVIPTALHTDIFHLVPSDAEGVQKALMEGKPIATGTAFGKNMIQLSDRLAGREESARKSSSFGGLLSLFSKTSS